MAARTKVVTNPEPYQAKLTKLEQRRAQLAESLDAVTHNAISASTLRRELIIANRDQQDLEEATQECERLRSKELP